MGDNSLIVLWGVIVAMPRSDLLTGRHDIFLFASQRFDEPGMQRTVWYASKLILYSVTKIVIQIVLNFMCDMQ